MLEPAIGAGEPEIAAVTLEAVQKHPAVGAWISMSDRHLGVLGYTEHGFRHAGLVANIARNVLNLLEFDERQAQLAAIAGYLHDCGNFISRDHHPQNGALLAHGALTELGMHIQELGAIMGAIGNHEQGLGQPVSTVGAALIVADKSDVHRSRVRNKDPKKFDIHDRVNHACESSFLRVDSKKRTLTLELKIDTTESRVMEYFEIFLARMVMCRRAAEFLDAQFRLTINGHELL